MRRVVSVAAAAIFAALLLSPVARAAETEWHSETPVGAGIGIPAPVGEVGDIEFEAPNRGVLITAGSESMPAGVYAYDGAGWHLYSTVCGGTEGRIAWSGPDEFWTISDYAIQQEGAVGPAAEHARTLCHFAGGQVVASYAEPLGTATTYSKMAAAACDGSNDCWFAGEPLPRAAPNLGPFHLHWDGGSLTAVPSLTEPQPQIEAGAGSITGLSFLGGSLFESAGKAPFLREVNLGIPKVFSPLTLPAGAAGPFVLGGDGAQLWAVATSDTSVLRSIGNGLETVPVPKTPALTNGVAVVAAEPNAAAAWVAGQEFPRGLGEYTALTRVSSNGTVSPKLILPQPSEELDPKGGPTAIACPAAGQCWLATKQGWLFHLGGPLPVDTDPAMHALITFRPADNSTRSFVPAGVPEDNSGETESGKGAAEELGEPFPHRRKARRLVVKVHQRVVDKTLLELSFTLQASAHVQLVAEFHKKVVAKTPRLTLGIGPHRLHLRLDPEHWPTHLDFRVHPAGARAAR